MLRLSKLPKFIGRVSPLDRVIKTATVGLAGVLISGCFGFGFDQSNYTQTQVPYTWPGQQPQNPFGVQPGIGQGQGQPGGNLGSVTSVAVLLPLSGQHSQIGANMQNAATLAAEDAASSGLQVSVVDTTSTPQGAASAANAAVNAGAQLILGPLLGDSLTQAAAVANQRGVGVLGFTNDVNRARQGAWAMGLAPEHSVDRMMRWAAANNYRRVAVFAPSTAYGQAAQTAANLLAPRYGLTVTAQQSYGADDISKNQTAELIASQKENFDAVLIPDAGNALREVSSLLYFHEVEPEVVKYMGLEGWDDPTMIAEQSLVNGVYAVPPTQLLEEFERRFQRRFGTLPEVQAASVYDAVMMAVELKQQSAGLGQSGNLGFMNNPFSMENLTRTQGFSGLFGPYRLTPNGRVERLYDVKQVAPGGLNVLEAAGSGFGGSTVTGGFPAG